MASTSLRTFYDAPAAGAAVGRVGVVDANLVGIVDAVEHDVVAYVGKRTGAHCGDNGRTRAKCLGNRFAIVIELCSVESQLPRTACHKRPLGGTGGGVVAGFGQCAYIDRRLIGMAGLKDIDHGEAGGPQAFSRIVPPA